MLVEYEYSFERHMPIKELFQFIVENKNDHSGWSFQHDESTWSLVWTPSIMKNLWIRHPQVQAKLEALSANKTRCKITTTNKGLGDPFKTYKKTHDKTFNAIFQSIQDKTHALEKI